MKLTKKLETEVLQVYNTMWDAYLKGDMRLFASLLDENCHIIGSAAGEVFSNKKAAVKYYKATAGQITGRAEFRNRKISIMPVDKGIMVNEQSDFYVLIEKQWTFYGYARISSLFHKKNNKWKVAHQHGSFPDSKTEEGEQVNTEKIKAENLQLRDAVKRRTVELENKNRELEIETALERVRAVAMAMKEPADMPDVCRIISQQLTLLGIKEIRNVQTAIFYESKGIYLNYEFFLLHDKTTITEVEYNLQPDVKAFVNQMLTDPEAFFTSDFKGIKLKKWLGYQKKSNQFVDSHLYEVKSLHYYFYSIGPGALGISTYAPLNDNELSVFKRFRHVFELAYRRYTDIEKAHAQAREAQIEAALEKVRSSSLAMHHSQELRKVVGIVFEKLLDLNFLIDGAAFVVTFIEGSKDINVWIAGHLQTYATSFRIPYNESPPIKDFWLSRESEIDFFSKTYSFEEKNQWFAYAFEHTDLKNLEESLKNWILEQEFLTQSIAIAKNSMIGIHFHYKKVLFENEVEILKRFSKVFDQAYIRFLDLQKAEAQAREGQIELSLERVRARSMAMQKSDELKEVIRVVYEQFVHLNILIEHTGFIIDYKANDDMHIWLADRQEIPTQVTIPYFDCAHWNSFNEAKEKGMDFFANHLGFEEKNRFYQDLFKLFPGVPEEAMEYYFNSPGVAISTVLLENVGLYIENFSGIPYTDEENKTLMRFGKVFQQTYTRFLDLQKAEAQVREAKIEASLERVRSRTMAMHNSQDVANTVATMFDELVKLGIQTIRSGLGIMHADYQMEVWTALPGENGKVELIIGWLDMKLHPLLTGGYNGWKNKNDVYSYELVDQDLVKYYTALNNQAGYPIKYDISSLPEKIFHNEFYFAEGALFTFSIEEVRPEAAQIFKRFAGVFGQTYRRYLDLQRAEAQAREAQIELGLERVRARAMAMQKSDELSELVDTVFKELTKLDFALTWCIINIIDEPSLSNTVWAANPDINKAPESFHMLFEDYPFHHAMMKGWKERNTKCVYILEGLEKKVYDEYLFNETEFRKVPEAAQAASRAMEKYVVSFSFSNFGGLQTVGDVPLSDANLDILSRFGKVFDLTYTRFNDLKRAEAQARESQIQLALERVRARTMAMQKSDELAKAASLLFTQIADLGTNSWSSGFIIFQPDELSINSWMSKPDGSMGVPFNIPVTEDPFFIKIYEAYKRGEEFFVMESSGKELEETYRYMFSLPGAAKALGAIEDLGFQMPTFQITHCVFFPTGFLMFITYEPCQEMWEIFKRFGKVFEQTYTRFLDLQKAEVQAREAQIEAGLERVRSRTMAMHKSDELAEVVQVVFEQLQQINFNIDTASFSLNYKEYPFNVWMAAPNQPYPAKIEIPDADISIMKLIRQAITVGLDFFATTFNYEEKNQWLNHVFEHTIIKYAAEERKNYMRNAAGISISISLLKHIALTIGNYAAIPYTEEENEILKRFAKVFEQTYTRFLDLQKAEEQAKESQIQLALERVRARTMAMQHSDELKDAAALLFQQVKALGVPAYSCGYNIWEKNEKTFTSWMSSQDGSDFNAVLNIPLTEDANFIRFAESREKGEQFFVLEMRGERMQEHYEYLKTIPAFKAYFDYAISVGFDLPETQIHHLANFSHGNLLFITLAPCPEFHDVFKRFAAVFEQTYTRFLDLQKAEAQAREARIEAGLERVRSRAMAMQTSEELNALIGTVFTELTKLDLVLTRCVIWIINPETDAARWWMANVEEPSSPMNFYIKYHEHAPYLEFLNQWKDKTLKWVCDLKGQTKIDWDKFLFNETELMNLPDVVKKGMAAPERILLSASFNNFGGINVASLEPLSDEHFDILLRFAKVFDLTYTRFNDLKQAEAQAREARIEASLEKVRARTMGMQKSVELGDVASILFKELNQLVDNLWTCGFVLCEKDRAEDEWWLCAEGGFIPAFYLPNVGDATHANIYQGWLNGETYHTEQLDGEALKEHYDWLMNIPVSRKIFEDMLASGYSLPTWQKLHCAYFSKGYLCIITQVPCPEEQIFKRFAQVFDLTYTRFLDLQKAEAQAREAKIEAGLERVRARTMAMHSSEDVSIATATMFDELEKLNIQNFRGGILNIRHDETMEVWSVNTLDDGRIVRAIGDFDMTMHPFWRQLYKRWMNKDEFFQFDMSGKDKEDYIRILDARRDYLPNGIQHLPDCTVQSYFFGEGAVWTFSLQPHSEEDKQLMKRFASVFSLTFRRYQDLKKAEAQAREATLEAALEKVRGKAMAMHNSNDLSATASLVFTELRKLGINPIRCGVGLLTRESRKAQLYSATSSAGGDNLSLVGWVMLSEHPVLEDIYNTWLKNEDYYPELGGEQLRSYYELLLKGLPVTVPDMHSDQKQYGTFLPFSVGCLYAWSESPYNDAEIKILKRFATIIDLTFRRYMELQKSEANAREAVKQAALDRVRADIASMRTIADLDKITPLIWNELTILGVPFIRCGVFIMDESQQLIHTFLSTPDGKAIAAFHLPYDTPGNFAEVVSRWHSKQIYIDHWGEAEFISMADTLVKQGAISTREQYLNTLPEGGFYLHFLPFLQGMLYVANTIQLGNEELSLIQSVADAFSTAYARYEDFNKLEAAKKQVDSTLNELQATQKQLIQSEKMASLGELTAGIAHEIQNPLNFVNNFSDVSNELLEEMKEELAKGNYQDAIAIADDVKQNLDKINHHGKRADGIVKGMLQHSRSSSGQKELTDINTLADEFLRLAYHGLRAKDKSFNAKLETDFDNSIGKINIISQDIGRVLVNLINNAFYAVSEKKRHESTGYEPTVSVSTTKENDKVKIKVKDNGNGIPQKVLDKIFQPFFTTKPTGQGTGLGLSLAYDIVTKGHSGELKVETKEREGSTFIIQLPVV